MVIGRDANSQFGSFIIDKGTLQGISKRDPVITSDGLIGVIEEVGLTYSRVITIYDPGLNIGAYGIPHTGYGDCSGGCGPGGRRTV